MPIETTVLLVLLGAAHYSCGVGSRVCGVLSWRWVIVKCFGFKLSALLLLLLFECLSELCVVVVDICKCVVL